MSLMIGKIAVFRELLLHQMAVGNHINQDRPFDMAVSDYWHTGNDLLWPRFPGQLPFWLVAIDIRKAIFLR